MTKPVSVSEARRLIAEAATWKRGKPMAPPTMQPSSEPAKPARKPTDNEEDEHQERLAVWLDQSIGEDGWTHFPAGGYRSKATAARLKRFGMRAGVSDCLIFTRPPNYPQARGVALELKRAKGGHTRDAQKAFIRAREADGWLCRVCEGYDAAVAWLLSLGYRNPEEP